MANSSFCVFRDLNIPPSSQITRAHIAFQSFNTDDGVDLNADIYFTDEDNAQAPTDKTDLDGRSLTSLVSWSNIESWFDNRINTTPELKTILQSVIDRANWAEDNNVMVVIKTDTTSGLYRAWSAYEYLGGAEKATLRVWWKEPIQIQTPYISPAEEFQMRVCYCSISTYPTDANIYYTTDGSTPTTASTLYTGPFLIDLDTEGEVTVKAKAYKQYWLPSEVAIKDYTILFLPGKFVAITDRYNPGDNAAISYLWSKEWNTFGTGVLNQWEDITWSPYLNKFVIVADETRDPGGDFNRAAYSSDGINWTTASTPVRYGHPGQWKDVCWSPKLEMFLAISAAVSYCAMYSSDGITWSGSIGIPQPVGVSTTLAENINDSQTSFTVVDLSAFILGFPIVIDDEIIDPYSSSGNTFTGCSRGTYGSTAVSHNIGTKVYQWVPPIYNWRGVCWSEDVEIFVAVRRGNSGFTNSQVMISSDGVSWSGKAAAAVEDWRAVCWSPELGLFCAVAAGSTVGDRVMTSPDGENWTERAGVGDKDWRAVCWSPELTLFVAVGYGGIMTSPNGVDWTARSSLKYLISVCWSSESGLFVTGGGGYNYSHLQYSSDGINWYGIIGESISNTNYTGVVWAPD